MGLDGKVALITGAGQGIGRATALRLARDGARIAAVDLNAETAGRTAEEVLALGQEAMALGVDVRDTAQLERMVAATVDRFGSIDILVASAGIVQVQNMMDVTEADWDRLFSVNARGLFFTLQQVARQMIAQGRGTIVNISSGAARGPRPIYPIYAASKAAVISITWTAAAALAPHGIRVNALCPGIVETPMWDQIDREIESKFGIPLGEYRQQRIASIPLGRLETAEDVADAVAFLASSDARYITGQSINVDGGMHMH